MYKINKYADTHFHLYFNNNPFTYDPHTVVQNAIKEKVSILWLASTNKEDIDKNLEFAQAYNEVKCWIGFHPQDYYDFDQSYLTKHLINNKKVVGIGEIGVDLDNSYTIDQHKKGINKTMLTNKQQEIFEKQIETAIKAKIPFVVHSRNAYDETIEVLQKYKNSTFLWHCYNLNLKQTEKILEEYKNIYFGLNCITTYKSGEYINSSIQIVPNNKILTETDAPFLAPRPFKYKYNTPEGVIEVYKKIAQVKNISIKNLQEQIIENIYNFTNDK